MEVAAGRAFTRCVSRNPVQSMVALTALGFLMGVLADMTHYRSFH